MYEGDCYQAFQDLEHEGGRPKIARRQKDFKDKNLRYLSRPRQIKAKDHDISCHGAHMKLKIYKDKLREVYQIFRVGQAPKVYYYFEYMLKEFNRDDLVTLWKLVKDRFKTELPKSDLERCLFWPLKVMFEPVATDLLWQFEAPIKSWKMYKSCKVHCLSMEGMIIYMLNDVEYPFQKTTLKKMLDHKCEVSEFNEDVIQMINLIRGQLKKE
ncbi:hypothetical protein Tco_0093764 [Tanacetum coccineum]